MLSVSLNKTFPSFLPSNQEFILFSKLELGFIFPNAVNQKLLAAFRVFSEVVKTMPIFYDLKPCEEDNPKTMAVLSLVVQDGSDGTR